MGVFIRSADLRFVTHDGWRAAYQAGVRTVIDLRNPDEIRPVVDRVSERVGLAGFDAPLQPVAPPPGMDRLEVPLDDVEDTAFWDELHANGLNAALPLYYRPFLERKPDRCAAVMTAVARAMPGGVLFHCGAGRDRTGLIALLLLALVGVESESIAEDYTASTAEIRTLFEALGRDDQGPVIERMLAERGTTAHATILDILDGFDVERCLVHAGVSTTDVREIRRRFIWSATDDARLPSRGRADTKWVRVNHRRG